MIKKAEILFFFFIFLGLLLHYVYNLETNIFLFLIFSVLLNFYPYLCLRYKISYVHLFFSIFVWLGFYFKYLCVEIIYNGFYPEIPFRIYSPSVKNSALTISSLACFALILSFIFYIKFLKNKKSNKKFILKKKIRNYLEKYFNLIIFLLSILILFITYFNFKYLIYQKGIINNESEFNFLNIPFKIALIYGFSSLLCLIIYFYNYSSKKIYFYFIFIFENFFSSISSFSRGMIFNSFSLILVNFYNSKNNLGIKINIKKKLFIISLILLLFFISLLVVEKYRTFYNFNISNTDKKIYENTTNEKTYLKNSYQKIFALITKRFVGIDSVILLSSKNNLKVGFINDSMFENFNYENKNFYEKHFLDEDVKNIFVENIRIIKTPGIIAYIYYSGSYLVLFLSMFIIGIILSYIEIFILRLSYNNIYLCSLLSQVIVYRLIHFGINPLKSLLFFVPIIFIMLITYLITSYFNERYKD